MKVADLIKDTVWTPGRGYTKRSSVKITITLPTYRRAGDGLFMTVAKSILGQSFKDLELIIIDDASTDGTVQYIHELMRQDDRVSWLHHPQNIGLPAVSEYEAYRLARGQYIGFAFDDFIFNTDAFEKLLAFADQHPHALVHGHIRWIDRFDNTHILGKDVVGYDRLKFNNFIGNSAVILPREIIQEIGLYDPHIAAARVCDWDLWRRVQRNFPMYEAPVEMGVEHGANRLDSLGNSYPMHFEVMQEYNSINRSSSLLPDVFEERDVWAMPNHCSAPLVVHAIAARKYFSTKGWADKLLVLDRDEVNSLINPDRPIVGILSSINPSVALCFDGLPENVGVKIQYIDPYDNPADLAKQLLRCDAIIVVRHLFLDAYEGAIQFCKSCDIPLYFQTDDNFIRLSKEYKVLHQYSVEKMAHALSTFKRILLSSQSLIEFFGAHNIHEDVTYFGPIIDQSKLTRCRRIRPVSSGPLAVGFFGGEFRESALVDNVLPALEGISREQDVALFARDFGKRRMVNGRPPSFAIHHIRATDQFDTFLNHWSAAKIDIVVHPTGDTENIDAKTANALLISYYLGAVPIVSNEPAYEGLGEDHGLLKVDGSRESWREAIEKLADSQIRADFYRRLGDFCNVHFHSQRNVEALIQIFTETKPKDIVAQQNILFRMALNAKGGPMSEQVLASEPPVVQTHSKRVRIDAVISAQSELVAGQSGAPELPLVASQRFAFSAEEAYFSGITFAPRTAAKAVWVKVAPATKPNFILRRVNARPVLLNLGEALVARWDEIEASKSKDFIITVECYDELGRGVKGMKQLLRAFGRHRARNATSAEFDVKAHYGNIS